MTHDWLRNIFDAFDHMYQSSLRPATPKEPAMPRYVHTIETGLGAHTPTTRTICCTTPLSDLDQRGDRWTEDPTDCTCPVATATTRKPETVTSAHMGRWVRAVTMQGETHAEGHLSAYFGMPSVIITPQEGPLVHWRADLTHNIGPRDMSKYPDPPYTPPSDLRGEPRYTLDEATRILNRQECDLDGHDLQQTSWTGPSMADANRTYRGPVSCTRCGARFTEDTP